MTDSGNSSIGSLEASFRGKLGSDDVNSAGGDAGSRKNVDEPAIKVERVDF